MTFSKFNLEGKGVLVTGGNGGIGLGMAEALAEAGADVCIWGRNQHKNRAAEERLRNYGRRAFALQCDVSDEEQVATCFAKSVRSLGRVDACFANAGIGSSRSVPFHEMTLQDWRRLFTINMEGTFLMFRAAIEHMLEGGHGGSLVATSSLAAISAMARGEHYAATKAGVLALVRSIAVEYARYGIRANAIVPGWIETEMTSQPFGRDRFKQAVMPRIPQHRWGAPADFEAIAIYFASDASAYHTGDMVIIDGGYSCF